MLLPLDEIVSNCAIATLKILILCLGGILLARNGVLSESQVRSMSKVSQDLLIPCLIFSNFVSINSKQIIAYSPVVLIAIAMIFIGIYVGKFLGKYFVRQERYSMVLQVVCGFPHTLNIQLAMVETLSHLLDKLDVLAGQNYPINAESRGIIFTMILTIVNTIVRWSVLTKLIKENEKEARLSGMGSSLGRSLEMRLLSSRGKEIRLIEPPQPEESTEAKSSFWKSFLEVMNPPLFMTLLAVVIALIPPVQNIFISESSLIYQLVTKVIIFLGQASSPILLVLLGANFGNPKSKGEKPSAFVVGSVTFAKMIVMPLIGYTAILALQTLSLMNDATMMIVVLSAFAAPTANNILIQYANLGKEMGAVSKMVLATYVCSVVTLPLTLVVFLSTYTIN